MTQSSPVDISSRLGSCHSVVWVSILSRGTSFDSGGLLLAGGAGAADVCGTDDLGAAEDGGGGLFVDLPMEGAGTLVSGAFISAISVMYALDFFSPFFSVLAKLAVF